MVGASITIEGLDAALTRLSEAAEALESPAGMFGDIAVHLDNTTRRRFIDGRAPDGSRWPQSLRAKFDGGRTLVDKGELFESITSNSGADFAIVGTNLFYAAIHQFGGMAGRGRKTRIPARPFLGISTEDAEEIETIATDALCAAFGGLAE